MRGMKRTVKKDKGGKEQIRVPRIFWYRSTKESKNLWKLTKRLQLSFLLFDYQNLVNTSRNFFFINRIDLTDL